MRIAGICIYSHALPVKDGPYRYSGNDLYSLDSTLSVPRVPATVTSNSSVLMLLLVCMLTSLSWRGKSSGPTWATVRVTAPVRPV